MTARAMIDHLFLLEALDTRLPLLLKQFPGVGQEGIEQAAQADPSQKKGYVTWILRMLVAGKIRLPEDVDKIAQRLGEFERVKKLPAFHLPKDINQYRSFSELAQAIDSTRDLRSGREETNYRQQKGIREVIDRDPYKVYEVTTPEAATLMAKGTDWCTKDPTWSEDYLGDGPLYVVFEDGKKLAQVHGPSDQWLDVHDGQLDAHQYAALHELLIPELGDDYRTKPEAALKYLQTLKEAYERDDDLVPLDGGEDEEGKASFADEFNLAPYEKLFTKSPREALKYAQTVLGGRFEAGEDAMLKNPVVAAEYASKVLRRRWPEAEPGIMRNGHAAYDYAVNVLRGPWPEAEQHAFAPGASALQTLANRPRADYMQSIHMGHTLDKERALASPDAAFKHAVELSKAKELLALTNDPGYRSTFNGQLRVNAAKHLTDWAKQSGPTQKEVEDVLLPHTMLASNYAINVRRNRWPEFEERAKQTDPTGENRYVDAYNVHFRLSPIKPPRPYVAGQG